MKVKGKDGRVYVLEPGADLEAANLSGLDLRGVDLRRANLADANLRNTNLEDANLEGADLDTAIMKGANLRSTNLNNTNVEDTNFKDAIFNDDTTFDGAVALEKAVNLVFKGINKILNRKTTRRGFFGVLPKAAAVSKAELSGKEPEYPKTRDGREIKPGANLRGADLSNMDLSGLDLRNINFEICKMNGTNFERSNLQGATFDNNMAKNVNFKNADLRKSNIIEMSLRESDLSGADFTEAKIRSLFITVSTLTRTIFKGATIGHFTADHADFNMCNFSDSTIESFDYGKSFSKQEKYSMKNCNFQNMQCDHFYINETTFSKNSLRGARIRRLVLWGPHVEINLNDLVSSPGPESETSIYKLERNKIKGLEKFLKRESHVSLSFIDLRGLDLSGHKLSNMRFYNCDLTNSNFQGATIKDSHFHSCELDKSDFREAKFKGYGSVFVSSKARKCDFRGIKAEPGFRAGDTHFDYSNFRGVQFENGTRIHDCYFYGANFSRTKFHGDRIDFFRCKLVDSDFTYADLGYITMRLCTYRGMKLKGALASGVKFSPPRKFYEYLKKQQAL